ncbi:hypothetical protein HQ489_01810 [Candidatus Woesearchaeota archaeon]|nr:hypothetical protein [Candidatus Woesearchaeota archaeon]
MNHKIKQESKGVLIFPDRKGIMVKFLVTLLLAIIIFVPSCIFVNKILDAGTRSSEQAKDNFVDFIKELNEFAFDEEKIAGSRSSTQLILDKETAIVYYEKDKPKVEVAIDPKGTSLGVDIDMTIQKPAVCKEGKNCICLLRKSEFEISRLSRTIDVKPKRFLCENLDYELQIDTCNIGEPHLVESYTCKNGFLIERKLVAGSSSDSVNYFEVQRRSTIFMLKEANSIRITGVS